MTLLFVLLSACAPKLPIVAAVPYDAPECGFVAASPDDEHAHQLRHEAIDRLERMLEAE